jgi:protein O-mannosyl-transferase
MAKEPKKSIQSNSVAEPLSTDLSKTINPYLIFGGLALIIFVIYSKIWQNDLVWDDDPYITLNEAVKSFNLKALLTDFHVGNYHPLTMLSLALEYLVVGEKPWLYHFDNLILHTINCFLLYRITRYLGFTEAVALILAALFAVHPMHVESVAWAAERKDVLYVLFLFLSFLYYLKYQKEGGKVKYVFSLFLFVFSCLSKGMAVVLPAILLITDWWILKKPLNIKNSIDKIPYFVITLIFAYIATTAQKEAGADATSVIKAAYEPAQRFRIVTYSYLFYWFKTILPIDLLPFYPYPGKSADGALPALFNLSVFGVILFSITIYLLGRKNKAIWWAAAFFTIAISTVIQILPVGSAIVADRYYYLSSVGPLFLIAYFLGTKMQKFAILKILMFGLLVGFSAISFFQTSHWKNGYTLFKPAEKFYPEDAMVLSNIGWYHLESKEFLEAKSYLTRTDNNGFKNGDVCRTLGSMYIDEQNYPKAVEYITRAQLFLPKSPRTDWLMALAYLRLKEYDKALPYSTNATKATPDNLEFLNTHAEILASTTKYAEARTIYDQIIKIKPDNYEAALNKAYSYRMAGDLESEIAGLKKLLAVAPNYMPAYRNLGVTYSDLGRHNEAVALWEKATIYDSSGDYEYNIGINYANRGQIETAKSWYIKSAKKGKKDAVAILKNNNIVY